MIDILTVEGLILKVMWVVSPVLDYIIVGELIMILLLLAIIYKEGKPSDLREAINLRGKPIEAHPEDTYTHPD